MDRIWLGAAALCFFSIVAGGPILAQNSVAERYLEQRLGTLSVAARPLLSAGKLSGCTLEFSVLGRDWAFKNGAFVRITGSFGLMLVRDKNVATTLKVVLHDFDMRTLQLTPNPPARILLLSPDGLSSSAPHLVANVESDTPGGAFSVFAAEPTLDMILSEKVRFSYSRSKTGLDVPIEIDTRVVETTDDGHRKLSQKNGADFNACLEKLLKAAL